ncbi:MAG: dTDP-4-dehydrorhamnose reductase [Planctomycetota bacterium]
MHVVITGAGGMLARELTSAFEDGWKITTLSRADLDVSIWGDVFDRFETLNPDVVINAAAYTDVDGCETNVDHAMRVNAIGAKNVAAASEIIQAQCVQVSTDFVFKGDQTTPYCENDPVAPEGVYARSKHWGEVLCREVSPHVTIVRTQWLYGHGGKNFVETILKLASERDELSIVEDQVGCPTFCRDLARGIRRLVEEATPGTYHLSAKGSCSWYEFAKVILEMAGVKGCTVKPTTAAAFGRPAPRPAYSVLRNYHLELTLGDFVRDWREMLQEYLSER